jgi:hypothetical protein
MASEVRSRTGATWDSDPFTVGSSAAVRRRFNRSAAGRQYATARLVSALHRSCGAGAVEGDVNSPELSAQSYGSLGRRRNSQQLI